MHIYERPPFSALNFRSGAYNFHKLPPKNPFRSITILHFLADFAVPETIIFKKKINFNPFIASVPRPAQFRRLAFSRSKRVKLVPEPQIFTLDRELVPEPGPIFHFAAAHTGLPKFGVSTPSPPPPPPPPRVKT